RPGSDRLEGARETVQVLTGREEVTPETAREYLDTMRRLGSASDDEQSGLVPVTLGQWLDRNVADGVVRNAILQVGAVLFPSPAESTSVGRLIGFLEESRAYGSRGFYPEDTDASGMQGLVSPWIRVIERHGGELWLGWKPLEIVVEDRRVAGVVAVDTANLVEEFVAPVVITDYPGWALLEIIDEDLLPSGFAEEARRMLDHSNDLAGWWAGLSRLPSRRSEG